MTIHVHLDKARMTHTPAATMRTYVSPTTTPVGNLTVWRTEIPAGTSGPLHTVDTDHIVVVADGGLCAEVDGVMYDAEAGDCLVLRAGSTRRLTGSPSTGAVTITSAAAGGTAQAADGNAVLVPWAR